MESISITKSPLTAPARKIPFKVFGLQRTGTNLLTALLAKNFRVESIEKPTEWKHGPAEDPERRWTDQPVRFLICVRNPYSWLVSCYRYFQKVVGRDPTVPPQFVQNPSMSFDDFVTGKTYEFETPVNRWNVLNRGWLCALPLERRMLVRLEDQLLDQIKVLERAQAHLRLQRRLTGLRCIDKRVDVIPHYEEPLPRADVNDRQYMSAFSDSLLAFVNRHLDRELLNELGYGLESWTLAEKTLGGIKLTVRSGTDDAAGSLASVSDLHDFVQIKRWSTRIESIVELGAGIGATALLAKRYWPSCSLLAFEPSGENLRLLRINARLVSGVTPIAAAGDRVGPIDLDRALNHFGGEIDVLRMDDADALPALIQYAHTRDLLCRSRWICGRLSADSATRDSVMEILSATHNVETRTSAGAEHFLARRVRAPRLRLESLASAAPRSDALTKLTAYDAATAFLQTVGDYPASRFRGRGIVICGGGRHYFPCAWVCINMLRHLGVTLPIELWGLNAAEIDASIREIVKPLGVRCVDASRVRRRHPVRILNGWELKPYSVIHSRFREVLFLDADNVAVIDPTPLFESSEYLRDGAIFWPAYGPYRPTDPIWNILRIAYREESDFETGQMLIDKSRCWRPLQLTMHLNENSDFYYQYTQGDKDTFHFAWRMLDQAYAMISSPVVKVDGAAWQHSPDGQRLFQHRYESKWTIEEANPLIPDFMHEMLCFKFLADLRAQWRPA